jgi:adenosine deaminase
MLTPSDFAAGWEARTVTELSSFIEGMPKAELHLHLEGTLEPELKFELAARNGLELPSASVETMRAGYAFHDLSSFLDVYYEGMGVLRHEADFHDLAMAYFRKAHSQQVVYAETFFDPQAHTTRGVPFEAVIGGLHRAQEEAEASYGLRSQLILCFLRDMTAESAMQTLEQSLPYRTWIVGVGLDSDEKGNPPIKFKDVFDRARAEGYHLTMHCDVDQDHAVEHIRQCLTEIKVERIDHGVNCLEDQSLVEEIKRRGLGLTVCPISNGFVSDGLKANEIKAMLDRGMRVTVNSDDPAYFGGYANENLKAVQEAVSLTRDEVVQLARNAFAIAWLAQEERDRYLEALGRYVTSGR